MKITDFRHPTYNAMLPKYTKWRDCWDGGDEFVDKYTEIFSSREDYYDFQRRKRSSPCPAMAAGAVSLVKNSIFQRIGEVSRKGGATSYLSAVAGDDYGVDLLGNSMNTFVGGQILPELLVLSKVGVFVDAPQMPVGFSVLDKLTKRPYIYTYHAEDILDWALDDSPEPNQFNALLLRENYIELDEETGLSKEEKIRFRYVRKIDDSSILIRFFDSNGIQTSVDNEKESIDYTINLPVIPFVLFELSQSLLQNIASYQIALLNMEGCDMAYSLKMNFPFYVEQYDPRSDATPFKTGVVTADGTRVYQDLEDSAASGSPVSGVAQQDVKVGLTSGRRYPIGAEAPSFINPSSEPLVASMSKQKQLKEEIDKILSLTLSNVTAASAEGDRQNRQGLEGGLHNIGMELEAGERRIAQIWNIYESSTQKTTVAYPQAYSLKTDDERRKEAKEINELKPAVPSMTAQKELGKQMIMILLQGKIQAETLEKIYKEIESAPTMTSDAEEISKDLENGLVSNETASLARGYPEGEVEQAKKDHAERIARIKEAQTSAIKDEETDESAESKEKKASTLQADGLKDRSKQRGDGK